MGENMYIDLKERLPKEFETVLTKHKKDLYPVVAYLYDRNLNIWMRETEGPEDIAINGRHEELYRPPTHWMPLPEKPRDERKNIK